MCNRDCALDQDLECLVDEEIKALPRFYQSFQIVRKFVNDIYLL